MDITGFIAGEIEPEMWKIGFYELLEIEVF
jgi:hypothetical protein